MDTLLRDLRFAFKMLLRRPTLTIAAVLCLALGIGATTVVFSLVSGVLLRPLPYQDPDRLYLIFGQLQRMGIAQMISSGPEFDTYRRQEETFEDVGMLMPWPFNLTSVDPPVRLNGGWASATLFSTLGVNAELGRTFTREEEEQEAKVAMISYKLWQREFNSDPNMAGRVVSLDGQPHTVVGVLPKTFSFLVYEPEVYVPRSSPASGPRALRRRMVVAKLADGVGLPQAQASMTSLARNMQEEFPANYPPDSGWGLNLIPMANLVHGDVRGQLLALLAAVGLVLLIACGNVANLLLAQATTRSKEVALRSALGAGRKSIIRQLLTESVALSTVGGILGVLLAYWGTSAVLNLNLGDLPRPGEIGIDWRVLVFALTVSVLTGLLFGLAPALKASRMDLFETLKEGGKTSGGSGSRRPLRNLLVVAEIALALVVLVGAGLMIRTVQQLREVDPGFRTDDLVTMELFLPRSTYPNMNAQRNFYRNVRQGLMELPEVEIPGLVSHVPLGPPNSHDVEVGLPGAEPGPGQPRPRVEWRTASPEYFTALEIPLLKGRFFTEQDHENAPPVVVVDTTLAERLWPGEDPVGKQLEMLRPGREGYRTVVGVAADIKPLELSSESTGIAYMPYLQYPDGVLCMALRARTDAAATIASVRQMLRRVDPSQPISNIQTGEQLVDSSISNARFNRLLFVLFGGAALLLTAVGVYGVMSYSVALRTQEMGLRMAMGARRNDVLGLVVRQGMSIAGLGVAAGLMVAVGLMVVASRVLATLLFGVSSFDAFTLVGVSVVVIAIAAIATFIPARRATNIDPMIALREE